MAVIEERRGATGKPVYRVKVRIRGSRPLTASFERKRDAQDWAQRQESDIRRGLMFDDHHAKTHTLAEVIAKYRAAPHTFNKIQLRDRLAHLRWWEERLGAYFLADVTPEKIMEAKRELMTKPCRGREGAARVGPASVNQYLISLSVLFNYAEHDLHWAKQNPMRKIKKEKLANGRVRYLSSSERKALEVACRASGNLLLYPVVMVALCTGMRKSEVLNLRWQDVDFNKRVVRAMATKNGEARSAPLTGPAEAELKALSKVRRLHTDLVFPRAVGTKPVEIENDWRKALEAAKIENFRFHDLRHTAATYLLESGATLPELSAILGHKTIQMVKRYAHLAENHAVDVVERMTRRVFG